MKDCEGKEGEAGDLRERPVTSRVKLAWAQQDG